MLTWMYLLDTNVISEARKGARADRGVVELRRGVALIRRRGDDSQAARLEAWLAEVVEHYGEAILSFDHEAAQLWGELRVPHPENAIDKQIAAIALLHDLTVVTRNTADFHSTGVRLLSPFEGP
jgi:predicted nucleic acid-binding protein